MKGEIREKNIDKKKLKRKTKLRDLHGPSAKPTMPQNSGSGEADRKISGDDIKPRED